MLDKLRMKGGTSLARGLNAEHVGRCISSDCQQWVDERSHWLLDLWSMHAELKIGTPFQ